LAANEEYDPTVGRWQTRTPLPTPRSGIAAAILGGKIFVFGGEAPSGTFHQVEAYEPQADSWSTYAPMPTARHGLGAAAVGERLYIISGGATPGASASSRNEIFTP
jgi:N-acetylneuraminic acid mutarotase